MNALVNGKTLPVAVLLNLQLELAIHVNTQNTIDHSTYSHPFIEGYEMREIKGLADTIRGNIKQLREAAAAATSGFANEVKHTQDNIGKVNILTSEMVAVNKEVEAILSDAGSNFAPTPPVDSNGVTVNKAK